MTVRNNASSIRGGSIPAYRLSEAIFTELARQDLPGLHRGIASRAGASAPIFSTAARPHRKTTRRAPAARRLASHRGDVYSAKQGSSADRNAWSRAFPLGDRVVGGSRV